jgi:hypothetical protein
MLSSSKSLFVKPYFLPTKAATSGIEQGWGKCSAEQTGHSSS